MSVSRLEVKAREVMNAHWQQGISDSQSASRRGSMFRQGSTPNRNSSGNTWGYTCPNPQRYIWQWLWDSCFHAIVWAELGEADRALLELQTLLTTIEPSGFVPHMNFVKDPSASPDFGAAGVLPASLSPRCSDMP